MESLLEILDQDDRIIHGVDDLTEARLKALAERPTALDADPESRFVQERKASLAFLENSLRAVEKS
jgi:hypothetical protein